MTVIATFSSDLSTTTTPKTVAVTTQPGDLVVVAGGGAHEGVTLNTPTGNGITFTLQQSIAILNYATAYVWTGVDATGGSGWTMSVSRGSSGRWGFSVMVVRDSAGIGSSVKTNASGAPSLNITTTDTDSTIAVLNTDWNAQNGARTWRTVNGITPTAGNFLEYGYAFATNYTFYSAYYPDVGAPGVKTVGLSAPGSQKYSIIALEVLPPAAPLGATIAWLSTATTPTLRAAATNNANTVNSLGVVIPATTQPGDLLVLLVAQTSFSATLFNAISGWTKQGEQRAGGAAHTMAVFTRVAQVGDAGTTVTSTSVNVENYTGQVRAYYGVDQLSPLETSVGFSQQDPASLSASAPAATVSGPNATVITAYSIPTTSAVVLTDANWASTAGFSNEMTSSTTSGVNNAALAVYDANGMTAGSQGPFGATVTDSRRWAMASIVLRAFGEALLYDTFSNAGVYSSIWATQPGTISGGRLHLTATAAYDNVLSSTQAFDFTGRNLSVQAPVVPAANSGESWLQMGPNDSNCVMIGKGGDSMTLRIMNGGVADDTYVLYNATNHAWWRLKLNIGGLVEWQTSPDDATWTTLRSTSSGLPTLTSCTVKLLAGHYDVGDPDEPADFDNIRLA